MIQLSEARPDDDLPLQSFLSSHTIHGLFDYQVDRPHSFVSPYQLTSQDHHTLLLRDEQGAIQASASVLFRKAFVNDQEQTVGYLSDLRVASSRQATLNWAKLFVPEFNRLRLERQCEFLFSCLELHQNKAYNFLLKRRFPSDWMPRYHLFRKFHLVAIFGRPFWVRDPLPSIQIQSANESDVELIADYLNKKSVRRPLRFRWSAEELLRRCREWPNFSLQDFLLARDQSGQLKGCLAPWNNSAVEQIRVKRYHGKSLQVFGSSHSLSWLGLARPLPRPGLSLKLKYLTHAAYDNPDIFYALLSHAFDACREKEILIYPNYDGDFSTRPPRSFLSIKIPYGFYSVLDRNRPLPPFLHPNPFDPPPDFQFCYF